MRHYVKIENGVVTNRAVFDDEMPKDWAGDDTWIEDETAQIGFVVDGGGAGGPAGRLRAPPVAAPDLDLMASAFRARRNQLLRDSDWTQLPDSPVDRERWAIYRQQLRDLPKTADMANPKWPTRPDDADTGAAERELDRAARTILFDGKK